MTAGAYGEGFGLAGKVALITGGNRNIGCSVAVAFAEAGPWR